MRMLLRFFILFLAISPAQAISGPTDTSLGTKMALAQQLLMVTHHAELLRATYSKQMKLRWTICRDGVCQADLDAAIDRAMSLTIKSYEAGVAATLAVRLSEDDLRAALAFSKSKPGQAFSRAELDASDDLAGLGHGLALNTSIEISRLFCAGRHDVCTKAQLDPMHLKSQYPTK